MSAKEEDKTSKVVVQLLKALAKIEALDRQDSTQFLGANQDFVFESDLHYGTYSGLRYGTVLDPYGLMAMLGFLVFLFYLIYNYLNASGNGRRSLDDLSYEIWRQIQNFN